MKEVIIDVLIPALNEEEAIAQVIKEIPREMVREVVVVDNNSTDKTSEMAVQAGATVLSESRPGYGWACLKGMDYLAAKSRPPDILVFLDGDHADFPAEMEHVVKPILEQNIDLVIGSRALGKREKGAMTPQQVFGNWLATMLMRWIYKARFTDLGPFRAIRFDRLLELNMQDKTYGWTVEMQIKAVKKKLACTEVAVNYRKRIGFSKVSGTVKGTLMAGIKILYLIFKYY